MPCEAPRMRSDLGPRKNSRGTPHLAPALSMPPSLQITGKSYRGVKARKLASKKIKVQLDAEY